MNIRKSKVPMCLAYMGCLCAGHARGNPASAACDTSEQSRRTPGEQYWERHRAALCTPNAEERAHVMLYNAIKAALANGWHGYGYACDPLIDLIKAARSLLNTSSGRLDCGALDGFYVAALCACGVKDEDM